MGISETQFERLVVGPVLGKGGEATVYTLPSEPALLFKRYINPSVEQAAKLAVMIKNPPAEMQSHGRTVIAWPKRRVFSKGSRTDVIGFLMDRVGGTPISQLYNTKARLALKPHFNWRYLAQAARNLCHVIGNIHAVGHVVGDVNDGGILVDDRAVAALVDCDSFQVADPAESKVYRCRVGVGLYTPAEIQGRHFADIDRTADHDAFGVGVLVFQLLMGCHPFSVMTRGGGEQPTIEGAIKHGWYPDAVNDIAFSRACPPIEVLPNQLRLLFRQSFGQPGRRPSAFEWRNAFDAMLRDLAVCRRNANHIFGSHRGSDCPWCERVANLSVRDPFPSPEAIRKGDHLKKPPHRRTGTTRPGAQPAGTAGAGRPQHQTPWSPPGGNPAAQPAGTASGPAQAPQSAASAALLRFNFRRACERVLGAHGATLIIGVLWLWASQVLGAAWGLSAAETWWMFGLFGPLVLLLGGVCLELWEVRRGLVQSPVAQPQPLTAGAGTSSVPPTRSATTAPSQAHAPRPAVAPAPPKPSSWTPPASSSSSTPAPGVLSGSKRRVAASTTGYVANRQSSKVHLPSCEWARKIGAMNRQTFSTLAEAERAGFVRCRVCRP